MTVELAVTADLDVTDWTVHVAAASRGGVQGCQRCDRILVDDRALVWLGLPLDRRYPTGTYVAQLDEHVTAPVPTPVHPNPLAAPPGLRPCTLKRS